MRIAKIVKKYPHTILFIVCCACASPRRAATSGDPQFYREHSKKLGVQLQGSENKYIIHISTLWLGTPYKYGGSTRHGIDCSTFVGTVYKDALGITLPRNSSAIAKSLISVKRSSLACGDIIFFTNKEKRVSHVGIYISDDKFVHSSPSGGVAVASLNSAYWNAYYAGAGRVKEAAAPPQLAENNPKKSTSWAEIRASNRKATAHTTNNASAQSSTSKAESKSTAKAKPNATEVTEKTAADGLAIVFDDEF
ncbi:MAG: C40 family peptidase [Prevotellaceae bacterium]|jgi:lipoprotein Spr|nr:C40 family peptidase [Prevotellaceae bacterium]